MTKRTLAALGIVSIAFAAAPVIHAKTTVRYFYWATSTELKLRQRMVAMFEKAYPDIDIKEEWCDPGVFDDKLIAMTAAGNAPDVVNMCNDWHGRRNPLYVPLDPYIQKDKEWRRDLFYPVTVDTLAQKGRQYAVPYIVKSAVLFANHNLLGELGIPVPSDDWTWDDLQTIAIKGSNKLAGGQKRYGLSGLAEVHAAWAYGGELFTPDMSKCTANNPRVMKGLAMMVDLIHKQQALPRSGDLGRFTAGKSPIHQGYSWDIMGMQKIIKSKFNWDIIGMPRDEAGHRAADVRVDGLAIMKGARNKDACWKFLRYMSSNRQVQDFVGAQEGIPPLRTAANGDAFLTSFPAGQAYNRKVLAGALSYGKVQPYGGYFAPIADVWYREIGKALDNKQSVEEAVKRFEQQSNAILTTPGRLH